MGTSRGFDAVLFFKALADRTRLRLINLMGSDELCVCFFAEVLGASQPKVSRHLAYLRRAGGVRARRDGKWVHYRVAEPDDPRAAEVLRVRRAWLSEDREMRADRERLKRVCCAPQLPVQLQGAPLTRSAAAGRPRRRRLLGRGDRTD